MEHNSQQFYLNEIKLDENDIQNMDHLTQVQKSSN